MYYVGNDSHYYNGVAVIIGKLKSSVKPVYLYQIELDLHKLKHSRNTLHHTSVCIQHNNSNMKWEQILGTSYQKENYRYGNAHNEKWKTSYNKLDLTLIHKKFRNGIVRKPEITLKKVQQRKQSKADFKKMRKPETKGEISQILNSKLEETSLKKEKNTGHMNLVQHRTKNGVAAPIRQPPRWLSFSRQKEVTAISKEMLQERVLQTIC